MRKYFGTDGIRGRVGEFPITPDFAMKLGYTVGKILARTNKSPSVLIGKDTRISGYLFESSLEAGFSYAGVNVYMAGPIPTPAVAYLTRALRLSAGVVISASHNSYIDNGIKFFSENGSKFPDSFELQIEKELDSEMQKADELGKVIRLEDARGRYIEFCKSNFSQMLDLKNLKIVLDCANGATYQVAPNILRELGAQVISIGVSPDGVNINYECGSTHPESLIKAVIQHNADLGIAFDGDGDRVLFVDKNGQIYDGDKLLYVIVKAYLASGKKVDGVVGTVMTNLGFANALSNMGINLIRSKVGDRYVLEELIKNGWILGGETSGHILCLDKHTTGDGIISALQVLSAIIILGKPLHELIDWQGYPQVMLNIKLANKDMDWHTLSRNAIDDAVKNLGESGRVIVRASGTEPLVRVMVEAKDVSIAKSWAQKIAETIK